MTVPTPHRADDAGRRGPVPGWVWIGMVGLVVAGALVAGWWFDRKDAPVTTAPGQPEAFCHTVGELQGVGELSVDIGTGPTGTESLRGVADGLRRLAAADPPAQITG